MPWNRKGKGAIAQMGRDQKRMHDALAAAMKKNKGKLDEEKYVYHPDKMLTMRKVLTYYGSQLKPPVKFATDPTFNKWLKGEGKGPLPANSMKILDLFWDEYVGKIPE